MDPALFGGNETIVDAPAVEDGQAQAEAPVEAAQQAPEPDSAEAQERGYSPNRPALRHAHARPKISYLVDELGEDEFNDILIPRSQRPPAGITQYNPENAAKDPLDVASAAILATIGASTTPAAASTQRTQVRSTSAKKRGRPRKSEGAEPQVVTSQPDHADKPEKPERRRGRPSRGRPSLDAEHDNQDNDSAPNLDAQLAQQLDGFDEESEVIHSEAAAADEPAAAAGPRRRGRPPRNAQPDNQSKQLSVELHSQPLMSMAERMRMKGKKVKIAGRKSSGAAKPATPARESTARGSSPAETESPAAPVGETAAQPAAKG
ncbi:hypothetical protein N658DRAFT_228037 [Parathielavia hyrcaniae]|uniref:Uncharacterized protein n=1 Tax=Parathielavia hyrcaniae TaxID=113614 RepID=A0AAN6PUJ7_9PEZI|nr:hypothetical protein N658DRAFT_228037 [Parathielavia hyrcaniae]